MAPNAPDPPIPSGRARHAPPPTSTSFSASLRSTSFSDFLGTEKTATISASPDVPSVRTLRRRESRQRAESLRQAAVRRSTVNATVQQANILPHVAGTQTGSSSDAAASSSSMVRGKKEVPRIVDANVSASPPATLLLIQSIWRSDATEKRQRGTETRTGRAESDIERQGGQSANTLPGAGQSSAQSMQSVPPYSHMPSHSTLQVMPGTYSACVASEVRTENNAQQYAVVPQVTGVTEAAEQYFRERPVRERAPAGHLVSTQPGFPLVVQSPQPNPFSTQVYSVFPPDEGGESADPFCSLLNGPSSRTRRRRESRLKAAQLRKAGTNGSSGTDLDLLLSQEGAIPETRARDLKQIDYGARKSAWNGVNGTIARGLERKGTMWDRPSMTLEILGVNTNAHIHTDVGMGRVERVLHGARDTDELSRTDEKEKIILPAQEHVGIARSPLKVWSARNRQRYGNDVTDSEGRNERRATSVDCEQMPMSSPPAGILARQGVAGNVQGAQIYEGEPIGGTGYKVNSTRDRFGDLRGLNTIESGLHVASSCGTGFESGQRKMLFAPSALEVYTDNAAPPSCIDRRCENPSTVSLPVHRNLPAPASAWGVVPSAADVVAPSAEVNREREEETRHGQPPRDDDYTLSCEERRTSEGQALGGSLAGWGDVPKAMKSPPRR